MKVINRLLKFIFYLLIFAGLLFFRVWLAPHRHNDPVSFFLSVAAISAIYMAYFIVSEGHWAEIVGCIIVSLLIDGLAALFPPLVIIVILWFLVNVAVAMQSIVRLIPLAIASLLLYVLLFPDSVFRALGLQDLIGAPVLISYIVFSVVYSAKAARDPLKLGLFKLSTMLLSVPLIALLVASVQSGLRNLFEQSFSSTTRTIKVPQAVRTHMRSGVEIGNYTRNVSKTITEVSVATEFSGVGAGMAVARATAKISAESK
ncbi:hypothetical protein ADM96_19580 [Burkholderia sp. ST111]|nr:hypothetical protein ADM96_19580 [Burkholderia sp. ST111]